MFQLFTVILIFSNAALALHKLQDISGGEVPLNLLSLHQYSLHDFAKDFGRDYVPGTDEWTKREHIFQTNVLKVSKFLSIPSLSWTPGITKFMDYTEHEYSQLLGYKGRRSRATHGGVIPFNPAKPVANLYSNHLPSEYIIASNGTLTNIIRDQGACGSCWAEATAAVLEGFIQHDSALMSKLSLTSKRKGQKAPTVSSQALVSCTPNPHHCGGTGGCDGSTAELAFEMVKSRGLPLAVTWPYQAMRGEDIKCKDSHFHSAKLGIKGYTVLPTNKLDPLKDALVSNGSPIVISVDATNWNFYVSGIYSDTQAGKGDFTVNHAVTLMGYKEKDASSKGYWLIKNSWGESFGEKGYIRIELKEDEETHCGWDEDTHIGLACDGDPDRAWVCGTCGILYDSSFPTEPYIMH